MKKSRRWFALACAVGLVAGATGCGSGGGTATAGTGTASGASSGATAQATKVRLRLNFFPYAADHAFFYYGRAQGFFKDEGIDLDIEPGKGSATTLKLIANGSDPVGLVDAGTLLRGVDEGVTSVKAAGVVTQTNPMAFIFKASDPIGSASDLAGKTLALTPGDSLSQILPAVLAKNKIPKGAVDVQSVQDPSGKEAAVLTGRADALLGYFTEQPLRLEATKGVDMGWLPFYKLGVNTLNGAVVFNADWLTAHHDVAAGFMRATQKAIAATVKDPAAAAKAFADQVPDFDQSLALKEIKATIPLLHTPETKGEPYGCMAKSDWEQTAQVLEQYAGVGHVDPTSYYTNDLLQGCS